jgi:hypothetical protein
MYGFVCFYNSKRIEVYATSMYAAKLQAIAQFKAPRSKEHMISVILAERADGSDVTHVAVD